MSIISVAEPLFLASGSPRRRELLEALGIPTRVATPAVDEARHPGEAPQAFLQRVVDLKLAAARDLPECAQSAACLVADTIVVVRSKILGKPDDEADAIRHLSMLAGATHTVLTRYAIESGSRVTSRTVTTQVSMRTASRRELEAYAATGEGLDKAGAYAIQGVGAFLVQGIQGSYTNVVGLPVCEVVSDLLEIGVLDSFPGSR